MTHRHKRIAYLGPAGTNTEEAVIAHDSSSERLPFPSVRSATKAVEKGEADEAVVALENSIEGSVVDNLDLLIHDSSLLICKELVLPITHCLLLKPRAKAEDVRVVYSHPQALAQCRKYLESRFSRAQPVATLSTSAAVSQMMAQLAGDAAAIAPRRAAHIYGAEVFEAGIQDHAANATRFVVLAPKDAEPTGDDKTSIAFSFAEDKPGQLYKAIGLFATKGINLSKIESRPAKEGLGKYFFLIDFDLHRLDPKARETLESLRAITSLLKIFGSYPRYRQPK
jgi:prephenate dehydratase